MEPAGVCGPLQPARFDVAQADARAPDALSAAQADSVGLLRGGSPYPVRLKRQAAYLEGLSPPRRGAPARQRPRGPGASVRLWRPPAARAESPLPASGRPARLSPEAPARYGQGLVDPRASRVAAQARRARAAAALSPGPLSRRVRSGVEVEEPDRPAPESTTAPSAPASTLQPQSPTADRPKTSRIDWAVLLLRVFREDVLLCPCGGRRVVLAFITEKKVVKEILEHLGLPTTGPPIAPARIAAAGEGRPPGRMTYRSRSKRCADGRPWADLRLSLDFALRGRVVGCSRRALLG